LRGLLAAYGQRRLGDECRLFVRFDSWHIFDLPIIRDAFPGIPCVFLYRRPVEVLASHQRERGRQMVPPSIDPSPHGWTSLDEYAAHSLASLLAAACEHHDTLGLTLVNYSALPSAFADAIAPLFGLTLTERDIDAIDAVSSRHGKRPYEPFEGNPELDRRAADPTLAELATRTTDPWYDELEARRAASRVES
jgi:hypothetical protein